METIKGTKINMTQVFLDDGRVVPVTVIKSDSELNSELENKDILITGVSKGHGFSGGMKKWGFRGSMATRGQSDTPRSNGSIGSQTPGRVRKGKKMSGRYGNIQVTVKGSKIVKVDATQKEFMVVGPVPGARNSAVTVKIVG